MRALVLGISGQDGSYLAEQLLADGVEVFGLVRSTNGTAVDGVTYLPGNLADPYSLERALVQAEPDEVYNLAAVTAPGGAWGTAQPTDLVDVTAAGPVRLLDAVLRTAPTARVVQASSSAIYDPHRYGLYGISKRFAHDAAVGYRAGRGVHVSNAILYSHTSPRQDPRFLAPTICRKIAQIAAGSTDKLVLTDVLGRRDWGYAPDYMRALPLIARHDTPGDYVVATGRTRTVREFVEHALAAAGLDWNSAVTLIQGNPAPHETPADPSALQALGWRAEAEFAEMIRHMVAAMP